MRSRPRRGRRPSPLYGVPTAIKDLNLTAGVRTSSGRRRIADFVPEVSDEVALRSRPPGMVSLGKTNTPGVRLALLHRARRRAARRAPRGTATGWPAARRGGAAAAVAAGLVPVAQGSDGGGSIRIPASLLRAGRASSPPAAGSAAARCTATRSGWRTAGPLARTVRDAAALLDVLAGRRPWATRSGRRRRRSRSWPPATASPGRLRIARFVEPVIADVAVDPECVARLGGRLPAAGVAGARGRVDVDVPLPPEAVPTFETCWAVLTALSVVPARAPSGCCGR